VEVPSGSDSPDLLTARRSALTLWVELTESCQYKCRFCYNYWRDVPPAGHAAMPEPTVEQTLSFLARCEFPTHVALAGGDPSAHPDFVDIAARFAACADQVTVVTHGGNLSAIDLQALSRLPNLSIQFSIPSLDSERYRFLTGMGKLDRVLTAMAMCRELAIPLSLSAVMTSRNLIDLGDLVELAAEIGAEYLVVNRFLGAGRGELYDETLAVGDAAFHQALEVAADIGARRGVPVLASGHGPDIRHRKAAEPKLTISIDGGIRLCSLVPEAIATLAIAPQELVRLSSEFWSSTDALAGCYCASR
jgi:MoaA/NifB/PqqE/SkfB family radical SAM enzyme